VNLKGHGRIFIPWALGSVLFPSLLLATVIHVGGKEGTSSLSEALGQAQPGDTLLIHKGVYREHPVVDKRVVLIGKNWPVLDGEFRDDVMTVRADSVVIRGLVFYRSGDRLLKDNAGLKLVDVRFVLVEGNRFERNLYGIYLKKAWQCTIRNNVFIGRADELRPEGNGDGIHLWNSSQNRVENNRIRRHRDGIYVEFSHQTLIQNNDFIENARYGIHYMYSHHNHLLRNRFINNTTGTALMYSKDITVRGNLFYKNQGPLTFGVLFKENDDSLFEENFLIDNTVGLFIDGSNDNAFRRNLFQGNGWAIDLFASSQNNEFTENNFLDNTYLLALDIGRIRNRFERNYWDNYPGYDLNGDGLGDTPHRLVNIFAHFSRRYPDLAAFEGSLATQAMNFAERVFPILSKIEVEDPQPLMRPVPLPSPPLPRAPHRGLLFSILMSANFLVLGTVVFLFLRMWRW